MYGNINIPRLFYSSAAVIKSCARMRAEISLHTHVPLYLSIQTLTPILFDSFLYYRIFSYIVVLTQAVEQILCRQSVTA